jgi:hypothetical protein
MQILIDNQKVVNVETYEAKNEDGHLVTLLDIENTGELLNAWWELDIAHRAYRWPDGGGDHDALVIAWVDGTGALVIEELGPHWDGRNEHDAHALDAIDMMLPIGTLKWGARIEEPTA